MGPAFYIAAAGIAAAALVFVGCGVWWLRHARYQRLLFAAFLEQGRREREHHIAYRPDQRLHAIQQRLARRLGRRAYSKQVERDIRDGLGG